MYIKTIQIKDVTCFDDITIDFTNSQGRCPWVVLLGENGTGKSTILQMLALALLGDELVHRVAGNYNWSEFIRNKKIKGRIEVTLAATSMDTNGKRRSKNAAVPYSVAFELNRRSFKLKQINDEAYKASYDFLNQTLYSDKLTGGWFACGYGPWRKVGRTRASNRSSQTLVTSSQKPDRFATLFDDVVPLTVVSDWLVDLEFRRLKDSDNRDYQRSRQLAIDTLERLLVGLKFKDITAEGDILFTQGGMDVSIHQLSDGYRSTAAWAGDLVRRLIDAFPNLPNPLLAEGVVLIDELDIHLHPKWQASVIEQAREIFPYLQFIVSSHSPFVAQDVHSDDKVIVLKKQREHVIGLERSLDIKGWRVDQILTSFLFDMKTTRDASVRDREDEYLKLLQIQTHSHLSPEEHEQLGVLEQWLQTHRSAPVETSEEAEVYDAAKSILSLLDTYLQPPK